MKTTITIIAIETITTLGIVTTPTTTTTRGNGREFVALATKLYDRHHHHG